MPNDIRDITVHLYDLGDKIVYKFGSLAILVAGDKEIVDAVCLAPDVVMGKYEKHGSPRRYKSCKCSVCERAKENDWRRLRERGWKRQT